MIRRDTHMLLAIAGFTACMTLFNGMHPGTNPALEPPEHVGPQHPGEYVNPQPQPRPGP